MTFIILDRKFYFVCPYPFLILPHFFRGRTLISLWSTVADDRPYRQHVQWQNAISRSTKIFLQIYGGKMQKIKEIADTFLIYSKNVQLLTSSSCIPPFANFHYLVSAKYMEKIYFLFQWKLIETFKALLLKKIFWVLFSLGRCKLSHFNFYILVENSTFLNNSRKALLIRRSGCRHRIKSTAS